jgi:hydroxymethylpyrimidine/phosphomethylpyrimidine kinase
MDRESQMKGRVLLIGEFITNGGMGLQGDIITTIGLGAVPVCAITQTSTVSPLKNTAAVAHPSPFIANQIENAMTRPGIDVIKVGAIHSSEQLKTISDAVSQYASDIPLIFSPVLTDEIGTDLLKYEALTELRNKFLGQVSVLVLGVKDAEIISGQDIQDVDSMSAVAASIASYGCKSIYITGGLLQGELLHEVLIHDGEEIILTTPKNTQVLNQSFRFGGGWVTGTAIAVSLAQTYSLSDAVNRARQYVDKAIQSSFEAIENLQHMNLMHTIQPFEHNHAYKPYTVIQGRS